MAVAQSSVATCSPAAGAPNPAPCTAIAAAACPAAGDTSAAAGAEVAASATVATGALGGDESRAGCDGYHGVEQLMQAHAQELERLRAAHAAELKTVEREVQRPVTPAPSPSRVLSFVSCTSCLALRAVRARRRKRRPRSDYRRFVFVFTFRRHDNALWRRYGRLHDPVGHAASVCTTPMPSCMSLISLHGSPRHLLSTWRLRG